VAVRAPMVGDSTLYLERSAAGEISARLISLEVAADKTKVLQRAYTFAQPARWQNALQTLELFRAMMPQDLRGAGTCDLKLEQDGNSLSYSCSGSAPEPFKRQVR
jgi:hypothetical protein